MDTDLKSRATSLDNVQNSTGSLTDTHGLQFDCDVGRVAGGRTVQQLANLPHSIQARSLLRQPWRHRRTGSSGFLLTERGMKLSHPTSSWCCGSNSSENASASVAAETAAYTAAACIMSTDTSSKSRCSEFSSEANASVATETPRTAPRPARNDGMRHSQAMEWRVQSPPEIVQRQGRWLQRRH